MLEKREKKIETSPFEKKNEEIHEFQKSSFKDVLTKLQTVSALKINKMNILNKRTVDGIEFIQN